MRESAAQNRQAAQDGQDRDIQNRDDQNRDNQNRGDLVREWIRLQHSALKRVQSFSVSETIHSTVDAGIGQRNFRLLAARTATRDETGNEGSENTQSDRFRMQREITQLIANGQQIPPERASRFFMMQRRTMGPEFARVMDTFHFPVQEAARWESNTPLKLIERGGNHFWQLNGFAFIRPPVGPPPNREPGTPGVNQPVHPPPPRKSFVTAWFTTDTFRLYATSIEFPLPGRLSLSIRTTYSSEGNLDVPVKRVVEGTIPMRRRNRAFAVQFKQTTDYSDFEINRN